MGLPYDETLIPQAKGCLLYIATGALLVSVTFALTGMLGGESGEQNTQPFDMPSSSVELTPGTEDTSAPVESTAPAPDDTRVPTAIGQLCGIAPGPNHWICVLPGGEAIDVSLRDGRGEQVLYYDDLNPETPGVPMAGVPQGATEITNFISSDCDLTIQGIGSPSPTAFVSCQ